MRILFVEGAYTSHSQEAMAILANGVRLSGDKVERRESCLPGFDAAVMASGPKSTAPRLSRHRIETKKLYGMRTLVLESAAIRAGREHADADPFYRLSWGGFLRDDSDYMNEDSPRDRWDWIADLQRIQLQPAREASDGHWLICLQKPSDASLRGLETHQWGANVAKEIKSRYPSARLCVRPHPLDKAAIAKGPKLCSFTKALKGAKACVTYTSLSAIEAICAGVPSYALNSGSLAFGLSQNTLEGPPVLPSADVRDQWLWDLAYTQWRLSEMRTGAPWQRMRSKWE